MQGICFPVLTLELVNHDNVCLFEFSCQIDWGFDFVGVEGFGSHLFEVELHIES